MAPDASLRAGPAPTPRGGGRPAPGFRLLAIGLALLAASGCIQTLPAGTPAGDPASGLLAFDPGPPRYPDTSPFRLYKSFLATALNATSGGDPDLRNGVRGAMDHNHLYRAREMLEVLSGANGTSRTIRSDELESLRGELANASARIRALPHTEGRWLAEVKLANAWRMFSAMATHADATSPFSVELVRAQILFADAWIAVAPRAVTFDPSCADTMEAAAVLRGPEAASGADAYGNEVRLELEDGPRLRETLSAAGLPFARYEAARFSLETYAMWQALKSPHPRVSESAFQAAWDAAALAVRSPMSASAYVEWSALWQVAFLSKQGIVPERTDEPTGSIVFYAARVARETAGARGALESGRCVVPDFANVRVG